MGRCQAAPDGQGQYVEAEARMVTVLELYTKVLGPKHPQTLYQHKPHCTYAIRAGPIHAGEAEAIYR